MNNKSPLPSSRPASSRAPWWIAAILLVGALWSWRACLHSWWTLDAAFVRAARAESTAASTEHELARWQARIKGAPATAPVPLRDLVPTTLEWLATTAEQHAVTLSKTTLGARNAAANSFDRLSEPVALSPSLRTLVVTVDAKYSDYEHVRAFVAAVEHGPLPLRLTKLDARQDEVHLQLTLVGTL